MRLRERTLLADIEQRDLAALDQRLAHLRGRRMRGRLHYQPARRLASTATATHAAAATVIWMPARARSLIEKYPEEYGMIVVGPSLTRMNASDEVNAAGATMVQGSRRRSLASATRIGTMMLAVTVLLENSRC